MHCIPNDAKRCTNLHLQHKNVAVGRLVGVQQPDQVGMVQSLKQSNLLQDLLSTQQLLVHVLSCYRPFTPPLVAAFGHREAASKAERVYRLNTLWIFFPSHTHGDRNTLKI